MIIGHGSYGSDRVSLAYTASVGTWSRIRVFVNPDLQVVCVDDMAVVSSQHDARDIVYDDFQFGVWHDEYTGGNHAAFDELTIYQ